MLFTQVDVNDNPRIGRQEKLSGVPVIRYYKDGKPLSYQGRMSEEYFPFQDIHVGLSRILSKILSQRLLKAQNPQ